MYFMPRNLTADLWMEDEVTERNLVLVASIPSSRSAAYSQQHQQQQQQLYAAQTKESQQGILIDSSGPSTPTSVASSLSSSPPKSMPRPIRTASGATRVRDLHDNKGAVPYQHDNKETEINEEGQERGHQGDVKMEEDPAYHSDDAKYVDSEIYELKELERRAGESGRMELSTRNLVGQIAVCGQIAPGLHDDTTHIWFAFSILSIRTEGFFKLRFCLSDLQRIPVGGTSTTICEVFSNTFHVQTPKRFDGTVDNNDIAVHLNKNGIKIPARKDEKKFNKNRNNNIKNIS
ncbi:hypothetical protein BGX23_009096 [Mortierella sp. AD031]|nr:hypothetical protein BGX23_009096 [Mortierella sp. AD031]